MESIYSVNLFLISAMYDTCLPLESTVTNTHSFFLGLLDVSSSFPEYRFSMKSHSAQLTWQFTGGLAGPGRGC
jgi:hypothetical protein